MFPINLIASNVNDALRTLRFPLFASFITLFLSGPVLMAQTATGSIVGIVHDPSGGVIVGAKITLTDVDKNQASTAVTNTLGYYSFPLLQPANYQLTVESAGFKQFVQQNIKLDVAMTLTINAIDPA